MSSEYNKHLRVMLPPLVPFAADIIVLLIVWNAVFMSLIMPQYKELISLQQGIYDRVVISSSEAEGFPRLKKLSNLITVRNSSNSRSNINLYILADDPVIVGTTLNANEIAISGKLAERLDLIVGSKISADFPIYDTAATYEVKAILPYLSDLYDTQESQDFAFAIVGYDENLYKHSQGEYVYLMDDVRYGEYMERNYSYSERYSVADEVSAIRKRVVLHSVFTGVLLLLIVLGLAVYLHKGINTEADKYYRDGYSVSSVRSINRKDHIIFIGIPFLIEMIWIISCQIREEQQVPYLWPVAGAMIIIFMSLSVIGGRRYGRAN